MPTDRANAYAYKQGRRLYPHGWGRRLHLYRVDVYAYIDGVDVYIYRWGRRLHVYRQGRRLHKTGPTSTQDRADAYTRQGRRLHKKGQTFTRRHRTHAPRAPQPRGPGTHRFYPSRQTQTPAAQRRHAHQVLPCPGRPRCPMPPPPPPTASTPCTSLPNAVRVCPSVSLPGPYRRPAHARRCSNVVVAVKAVVAVSPVPPPPKKKRSSPPSPPRHRNMPTHSDLVAALVSQPSTAQRMSLGAVVGSFAPWPPKPTPPGDAFVGFRFSKQSAQYTFSASLHQRRPRARDMGREGGGSRASLHVRTS